MEADVEPIVNVAKQVVGKDFEVIQSRSVSLDKLLKIVNGKTPIWGKVTQEFTVPNDYSFEYWNTTSGQVKVTPLNHAVVITGYDKKNVYVNDPYGYKNRAVSKEKFEYIFDSMGRQSLYLSD
ncbi:C39 family peptidase [Enterococcus devriesei]|uniref:C39 family peptidase n=1 Tax=Enterococcus devriesei TaxID=319970 RepID=UPI0036D35B89